MKRCPECNSIDVPDKAKRCPFCGYQFETPLSNRKVNDAILDESIDNLFDEILDKSMQELEVAEKPQSMQEIKNAETKKSEQNSSSAVTNQTVNKKKKSGLQNFILILIIIVIVCGSFFYVNGENNQTYQSNEQESISASASANTNTDLENIPEVTEEPKVSEVSQPSEADEETELLSQTEYSEQYILPLSDKMYLTREDLVGLSAEELRIARNEIYARHGRMFLDEELQSYFNHCTWYSGTVSPDNFSDTVFNEYEAANKDLIKAYEHELGVNGQ